MNPEKRTVAIACGGSGGHIYPALAVAHSLTTSERNVDVIFIGSDERMEKDLIPAAGYRFWGLPIRQISLRRPLRSIGSLIHSLYKAFLLINRLRPQVIVGGGNYITLPTVLVGWLFRIPIILMETNVVVGKANRFLARLADVVTLAYESSAKQIPHSRVCVTGSPIRAEFGSYSREQGAHVYGLNPALRTLLVVGGSQGAQFINEQMVDILSNLMEQSSIQVVHICGEQHLEEMQKVTKIYNNRSRYHLLAYADNIPALLACTDLAVSRAGAAIIAELMACRVPAVLIPGSFGGGHQKDNAKMVLEAGAGILIEQEELTNQRLWHIVRDVIMDTERLHQMQQNCYKLNNLDAADRIVRIILQINQKQGKEARAC